MAAVEYRQFCPVSKALELLGERWTLLIIREMLVGARRFSELQRGLAQISPTMLTKRLKQLADDGLIVRKRIPGQSGYEYFLSEAGRELFPVILALGQWGMKWARGKLADSDLDVDLRTMIEIWMGDRTYRAAQRDGKLKLSGLPALTRNVTDWMTNSAYAGIAPPTEI